MAHPLTNNVSLALWYFSEHLTVLFAHWCKIQLYQHTLCWCPLSMYMEVSQLPCTCHLMLEKLLQDSLCSSPMLDLQESLPLFDVNTLLGLRIDPKMSFKSSNSSLCDRLLGGGLDALLHLKFYSACVAIETKKYKIPWVLFIFYFSHEWHHFDFAGPFNADVRKCFIYLAWYLPRPRLKIYWRNRSQV